MTLRAPCCVTTVSGLFVAAFLVGCSGDPSDGDADAGALALPPLAQLASLTLTGGTLDEPFDPTTRSYDVISRGDAVLTIDGAAADRHATISAEVSVYEREGRPGPFSVASASLVSAEDATLPLTIGGRDDLVGVVAGKEFALISLTVAAPGLRPGRYTIRVERRTEQILRMPREVAGARFGSAVATDRGVVVVGAPFASREVDGSTLAEAGAAFVYRRVGPEWELVGEVAGPEERGARFGTAVAVDGDRLYIGAPGASAPGAATAGAVHVHALDRAGFPEVARLTSTVPTPFGLFGAAIAVGPSFLAVGAPGEPRVPGGEPFAGAVHVYTRDPGGPVAEARLLFPDARVGVRAKLGSALAIAGERLAAGATDARTVIDGVPDNPGTVLVFDRVAPAFFRPEATLEATDDIAAGRLEAARFGAALAFLGPDRIVVGAPLWNNVEYFLGATYVFAPADDGTGWAEEARYVPPDEALGGQFGGSFAAFGGKLAIGAPLEFQLRSNVPLPDGEPSFFRVSGTVRFYDVDEGALALRDPIYFLRNRDSEVDVRPARCGTALAADADGFFVGVPGLVGGPTSMGADQAGAVVVLGPEYLDALGPPPMRDLDAGVPDAGATDGGPPE